MPAVASMPEREVSVATAISGGGQNGSAECSDPLMSESCDNQISKKSDDQKVSDSVNSSFQMIHPDGISANSYNRVLETMNRFQTGEDSPGASSVTTVESAFIVEKERPRNFGTISWREEIAPRRKIFNIIFGGHAGVGKSTTIQKLFDDWEKKDHSLEKVSKTTCISKKAEYAWHSADANATLKVCAWDTPGAMAKKIFLLRNLEESRERASIRVRLIHDTRV